MFNESDIMVKAVYPNMLRSDNKCKPVSYGYTIFDNGLNIDYKYYLALQYIIFDFFQYRKTVRTSVSYFEANGYKERIGRFCSKGILDLFREYMLYNDMFVYFNPNIKEITFKDYSLNCYDLDTEYKLIIDQYCTRHNLCSPMETGSSGFLMI